MSRILRSFLVPLLICEAIIVVAQAIQIVSVGETSLGPEGKRGLEFALLIGVFVVLFCWPFCRMLHRLGGTLVGLGIGLATPIAAGWIWAFTMDYWMNTFAHFWTPVQAWAEGLELFIPCGVAGAIVGFLQAKRKIRPPA